MPASEVRLFSQIPQARPFVRYTCFPINPSLCPVHTRSRCGPGPEGRCLPIEIDSASNGECVPRPLERAANREAQRLVGFEVDEVRVDRWILGVRWRSARNSGM